MYVADLRDPSALDAAVRGAPVVFHLAAMKSMPECEAQPVDAIRTNIEGSASLLALARQQISLERFIAVSSTKAVRPVNVYGMTKALMERLILSAARTDGRAFVVVRLGNEAGVRSPLTTRLIQLIHEIERGERPQSLGTLDAFAAVLEAAVVARPDYPFPAVCVRYE